MCVCGGGGEWLIISALLIIYLFGIFYFMTLPQISCFLFVCFLHRRTNKYSWFLIRNCQQTSGTLPFHWSAGPAIFTRNTKPFLNPYHRVEKCPCVSGPCLWVSFGVPLFETSLRFMKCCWFPFSTSNCFCSDRQSLKAVSAFCSDHQSLKSLSAFCSDHQLLKAVRAFCSDHQSLKALIAFCSDYQSLKALSAFCSDHQSLKALCLLQRSPVVKSCKCLLQWSPIIKSSKCLTLQLQRRLEGWCSNVYTAVSQSLYKYFVLCIEADVDL